MVPVQYVTLDYLRYNNLIITLYNVNIYINYSTKKEPFWFVPTSYLAFRLGYFR